MRWTTRRRANLESFARPSFWQGKHFFAKRLYRWLTRRAEPVGEAFPPKCHHDFAHRRYTRRPRGLSRHSELTRGNQRVKSFSEKVFALPEAGACETFQIRPSPRGPTHLVLCLTVR